MLVVDEAHLYRGASGAEVALLIRRLRTRLGIPPERLQVICTSASFQDPDSALEFAAQLTGKAASDFTSVQGELDLRPNEASGTNQDAISLASIDLGNFYEAHDDDQRLSLVESFLEYRQVKRPWQVERSLYDRP